MKRTWRRVQAAMKNESQKLLWLGATMAAPSFGMQSAPETCMRKYTRNRGATIPRTRAYNHLDTPFSRASRWASSLLTGRTLYAFSVDNGRVPNPYEPH